MSLQVITIFVKCAIWRQRRKTKEIFREICWLISWEQLKGFYSNLPCDLQCKFGAIWIRHHEATDAWKSRLCCSPVNMLTPFVYPHFLGPYNTLLFILMHVSMHRCQHYVHAYITLHMVLRLIYCFIYKWTCSLHCITCCVCCIDALQC